MQLQKQEKTYSIKTAIRCRPSSMRQKQMNLQRVVKVYGQSRQVFVMNLAANEEAGTNAKYFNDFDYAFDEKSTQNDVFQHAVLPLILESLNGKSATILAYGQTGSGKTHTVFGHSENIEQRGIVYRAVMALFAENQKDKKYEFKVSMMYLYNQQLRDLIGNMKESLKIKQDIERGVYVQNLSEIPILSEQECFQLIKLGIRNKNIRTTMMSCASSRQHDIFVVKVYRNSGENQMNAKNQLISEIFFVDLAGSQKIHKRYANPYVMKQVVNIVKSLSSLHQCIFALAKQNKHVPYRDSKMTRLLQNSFTRNYNILAIGVINPAIINYQETISTLRFINTFASLRFIQLKEVKLQKQCKSEEFQFIN